jgi:sec-independent protein translocase protein TatC
MGEESEASAGSDLAEENADDSEDGQRGGRSGESAGDRVPPEDGDTAAPAPADDPETDTPPQAADSDDDADSDDTETHTADSDDTEKRAAEPAGGQSVGGGSATGDSGSATGDDEGDGEYVPPWEESEVDDDEVTDVDHYESGEWGDPRESSDETATGAAPYVGASEDDADRHSSDEDRGGSVEPSVSDGATDDSLDGETDGTLEDETGGVPGDGDGPGDTGGASDEGDADAESPDDDYVPPWEQSDDFEEPDDPAVAAAGTEAETTDPVARDDAAGPAEVSPGAYADDDDFMREGPESDQEMPLAEHIEEMVRRLAVVLLFGGAVTLLLFPGSDILGGVVGADLISATDVINYLWNSHIPNAPEIPGRRPRLYGPLELILTELKVAALAGFVVSLPVFVYETYLFMRPGLYPKERRYYLAAVPTSLILALIGVAFAHFIVLPAIFAYFTSYTVGTAVIAFGLKETFNLILVLMGYMALVFQIPLFIMLAIMMGLVTRQWLTEKRLLFWGGFLGLAFFVSPDPTGMAPIIIAATMIGLFEGTLALLKWTGN